MSSMATLSQDLTSVFKAADNAAQELVSVRHWGGSSFLNLPLIYPSGSHVTVRIDAVAGGLRVSDNGFAYREAEAIGAERAYARTAGKVAEDSCLHRNARMLFIDVAPEQLTRAICDVGLASWQVVDRIYSRQSSQGEEEASAFLQKRLGQVFGPHRVRSNPVMTGASNSEWKFSAVVEGDNQVAVFHMVPDHPASIYRTVAAFHDLAVLASPPARIAVVEDKRALGTGLHILAHAGKVLEAGQPDEVFLRVAA